MEDLWAIEKSKFSQDRYLDQFMRDFPGQALGIKMDVLNPEKVIDAVKSSMHSRVVHLKLD